LHTSYTWGFTPIAVVPTNIPPTKCPESFPNDKSWCRVIPILKEEKKTGGIVVPQPHIVTTYIIIAVFPIFVPLVVE
jgi:hypothetical protein